MNRTVFIALILTIFVSACTKRQEISPVEFVGYSCEQLDKEISALSRNLAAGTMVFIASEFDNDISDKLAYRRARYKALREAREMNGCNDKAPEPSDAG